MGIYAASLTPMHHDLSCDYDEWVIHCQELIKKGCKGVVLFGTTGEGPSFSVEERKQALKTLIEKGVDPQKIILGVMCSAIGDAAELARTASKQKCAAALIIPPFFYKDVSDEGVIAFYREVIYRAGDPRLKILLYHIPQYSGVRISLNVIQTLREEFPNNVVGIKDSEGNLPFIMSVIDLFPDFSVFAGKELLIPEAVQYGATGGISGIANTYPELICSLCEPGNEHEKIDKLMEVYKGYRGMSFVPAMKAIMEDRRGSRWHNVRPPLQ